MTKDQTKRKIIKDFELMKSFELSAKDLYAKIASDPRVKDQGVKNAFNKLSQDEQRHAGLVQEIIDLVNGAL